MLLYVKPLTELAIGEAFQVTVDEDDWDQGVVGVPDRCAVALSIKRKHGISLVPIVGSRIAKFYTGLESLVFEHDASHLVDAFDRNDPFPGPTIVTLTRMYR